MTTPEYNNGLAILGKAQQTNPEAELYRLPYDQMFTHIGQQGFYLPTEDPKQVIGGMTMRMLNFQSDEQLNLYVLWVPHTIARLETAFRRMQARAKQHGLTLVTGSDSLRFGADNND
jgi:hypothetical protein